MTNDEVIGALKRVRARVKKGWVQYMDYCDKNGKECKAKDAVGCCLAGAIDLEPNAALAGAVHETLLNANEGMSIIEWQDQVYRHSNGHIVRKPIPAPAPILNLLRKAIALAKKEEQKHAN
jgi:hypothetical protein